MSSESDNLSSSSDSDSSSDEGLDRNVINAFNAMRSNLSKAGLKNKAANSNHATSNKHKLIYETFKMDKNVNSKKNTKKKSNAKTNDTKEANSFMNKFFIDKSSNAKTDDDNHESILAYDLTNFDVGDGDLNETISYDLTNICDIESEQDTVKIVSEKAGQESRDMSLRQDPDIEVKKLNEKKKIKHKKQKGTLSSALNTDVALTDVYVNVDPLGKKKSQKEGNKVHQKHAEPEIMKKSVISDDYEKQDVIETTHVSVRQQKKQRRLEREKTKGSKWFNMPATELTEERKNDLAVLQMRKVLDPKRFYKAHDLKAPPKYFQFGKVVEDATDFYSSRIPKKQRKSTVVEELLADAEFRKFNKRKYEEVQEAKRHGKGPYKHMKRLKKRKK